MKEMIENIICNIFLYAMGLSMATIFLLTLGIMIKILLWWWAII
jgi:hypothetical protein